ncbi:hypothetical protein C0585_00035 [Candidatus Woesearchaeota archaeon]|nr:MAG: hypothetical protein C0585_00035 [Candidatus Woesearchaeota archaeon]
MGLISKVNKNFNLYDRYYNQILNAYEKKISFEDFNNSYSQKSIRDKLKQEPLLYETLGQSLASLKLFFTDIKGYFLVEKFFRKGIIYHIKK